MNSIIPNRNLPLFKSQKNQKKNYLLLFKEKNQEKSNKKLDDRSNIILKLFV